jgi:hypothetical protein
VCGLFETVFRRCRFNRSALVVARINVLTCRARSSLSEPHHVVFCRACELGHHRCPNSDIENSESRHRRVSISRRMFPRICGAFDPPIGATGLDWVLYPPVPGRGRTFSKMALAAVSRDRRPDPAAIRSWRAGISNSAAGSQRPGRASCSDDTTQARRLDPGGFSLRCTVRPT